LQDKYLARTINVNSEFSNRNECRNRLVRYTGTSNIGPYLGYHNNNGDNDFLRRDFHGKFKVTNAVQCTKTDDRKKIPVKELFGFGGVEEHTYEDPQLSLITSFLSFVGIAKANQKISKPGHSYSHLSASIKSNWDSEHQADDCIMMKVPISKYFEEVKNISTEISIRDIGNRELYSNTIKWKNVN